MATLDEQIEQVEKELRETPHHKATDHYIGMLRAKLSKLKDRQIESGSKKGGGGGYAVKKQGDATVVLVGPPSAGKSTLINVLTNAQSKVAPYAFTTLTVIPGMMVYNEARIQILDVPGLIEGAEVGKGRGREVLSVVRGADLIILMTDPKRTSFFERIEKALYDNGIRVNQHPPDVTIEKKLSGGIIVHTNIKQDISKETIKDVASEMGIKNGEITINEKLNFERLMDAFSKNRIYIKSFRVVNKEDLIKNRKNKDLVYISAEMETGIEKLKEEIWKKLEFITVYLIKPQEEPGTHNPMILKQGSTLTDILQKLGDDFALTHSKAKIWGEGAKFPGQEVSLSIEAKLGMQIRFI